MRPILISEAFGVTIQGEGKFSGVPSNFVRTSGCGSRCAWCDTPYTSWNAEGNLRSVEDVLRDAAANGCTHVVITGGEPMIFPEQVGWLTEKLQAAGRIVTIETAGNIYDERVKPDLWSVSPKLKSSTPDKEPERSRHIASLKPEVTPEFLRSCHREGFGHCDVQYKFVVVTGDDVAEVLQFVENYALPRSKVWLMPEGITRDAILDKAGWVAELCKQHGFNLTVRMHALLWGAKRGV